MVIHRDLKGERSLGSSDGKELGWGETIGFDPVQDQVRVTLEVDSISHIVNWTE